MMAFNPAVAFNPLLTPTTAKSENASPPASATNLLSATTTPTTGATPAPPTPQEQQMRFLAAAAAAASNPLLQQFQIPPPQAMMAQALAAQAAQAQGGLGFPVVFPPGLGQDFKPEMMMSHGPMGPVLMDQAHFYHPYSLEGMKKRNATKEATEPLKIWLRAHQKNPYPTKGDKVLLAMQTRMTLTQVSTWFANARRRLKKENKMTWSPQNRRGDCDDDDFDNEDDDLNRPSSSNSIVSTLDLKIGAKRSSPCPSGGSSDDLLLTTTPKKAKIWSIADVASEESDKKDSSPSSDENTASNLLSEAMRSQKSLQENLMAIARHNPHLMASMRMMNPAAAGFMFNPMQLFAMNMQQQAAQAAAAAAVAAQNSSAGNGLNLTTSPTQNASSQGLQSEESGTTPTSEASPVSSPKVAPRTATPAY